MLARPNETAIAILLLILAPGVVEPSQQFSGKITGTVLSPAKQPLPGVIVALTGAGEKARVDVTDAQGNFAFEVPQGAYRLAATLPGYEEHVIDNLEVESGGRVELELNLSLVRISESIVIEGQASSPDVNDPREGEEFRIEELDLLPLPSDRFQEAFPLVPGVVRDPEGRLSFNGARPSQSILLVNGTNATDPLTGEFAVEIPLKAIEAVEVNHIPYSAEYGRVTAAVAEVTTRGGSDEWHFDFDNLFPSLNFRDGTIQGIKSAVPQFQVSGPLKKGKAWFSQGFTYRFVRSRAYDVESSEDERVLEGYDSFSQLDFRLGEKHHLTTTFSYFPVETDNLGIDALTPAMATPDFNSWGWNAAISERSYFSRTMVETIVAVKSFDVAVRPKHDFASRLTPEGLRDNYFNELNRESIRVEIGSACTHSVPSFFGEHVLEVGANVARASFGGTDEGLPVELVGADGRVLRTISFAGDPRVGGSDLQVSGYVQDQWRPNSRLGLDVGLRYDFDRLVREHQLAPRFSGAFALDGEGRTVLKAGWGIFYDHVFLHAGSFERFQSRIETRYGTDGVLQGAPVVFENRIAEDGLEMPRSKAWNVEVNRRLAQGLQLRVNYRERRGSREMIVDRLEDATRGTLLLSSKGESTARQFDVTLRLSRPEERELFFSYVKSRSTGDLNNFGDLYQSLRSPLVLDNEDSLFQLDVPHRFLFWGFWTVAGDIHISPGVEWRSGFPYTVFDEEYTPVGVRNRGGRFPVFFSADVRVTKGITLLGKKARVGFQIFNLGSRFNARDVVANLGSPRFGEFLNSVDMGFSLRFRLLF